MADRATRRVLILALALLPALAVLGARPARAATPSVPPNFQVVPTDSGAYLSWGQPTSGTAPFAYEVSVRRDDTSAWTVLTPNPVAWTSANGTPDNSGPHYNDTQRLNRSSLEYRVRAQDATGVYGDYTSEVPVTPEVVPYGWYFSRPGLPLEGWGASGTYSGLSPAPYVTSFAATGQNANENGDLALAESSATPSIDSQGDLNIPSWKANYQNFELRIDAPRATTLKVSWWRALDNTEYSFTTALTAGWQTITHDMKNEPQWSGYISKLRIYPAVPGTAGDLTLIKHVKLAAPAVAATPPLIGAIRWDSWFPNAPWKTAAGTTAPKPYVDPSLYTDYDSRQPFYGWFDAPRTSPPDNLGPNPNPYPNHQKVMDQEIEMAAAEHLDFWAFDWYESTLATDLASAIEDYRASTVPNKLDYSLIIEPANLTHTLLAPDHVSRTTQFQNVIVPMIIDRVSDPTYLRLSGNRPVIFFFNTAHLWDPTYGFYDCSGSEGCWDTEMEYLVEQIYLKPIKGSSGLLGMPYFVDVNNIVPDATHDSLTVTVPDTSTSPPSTITKTIPFISGLSSYGPSGTGPLGSGHQSWNTLAALDQAKINTARYAGSPAQLVLHNPGISPTMDHRPRNSGSLFAASHGSPSSFWFEQPTYSQWESDAAGYIDWMEQYPGRTSDPGFALLYAWNEIDEGGGIVPEIQQGTKYLDGIGAAKTGNYPASYWDVVNDSDSAADGGSITYSGGWRYVAPQNTCCANTVQVGHTVQSWGDYGNDEHTDPGTVTTDSASLTYSGATAFRLVATTAPDRGQMSVTVTAHGNVVASSTIDLYSPTTRRQQIVGQWTMPSDTYTLTLSPAGSKNAASSGFLIGVDTIAVRVERLTQLGASPPATPEPPTRVVAQGRGGEVDVSWDPVLAAAAYNVYRSPAYGGPFVKATLNPVTATTWTDTGSPTGGDVGLLPGNTAYYYVVTACTAACTSESGFSGVAPAITSPNLAIGGVYSGSFCSPPTVCSPPQQPVNAFDGQFGTSWQAPPGSFSQQWLRVDFGASGGVDTTFNRVLVDEAPDDRTSSFVIEYCPSETSCSDAIANGGWVIAYDGTLSGMIGPRRWITFPAVTGNAARLRFISGTGPPIINEFQIFER
jgi:hypothetical protein